MPLNTGSMARSSLLPFHPLTFKYKLTNKDSDMERSMERRSESRYNLRAPLVFRGNDGEDVGFTTDISEHGACIVCNDACCPHIGEPVTITLALPAATEGNAAGATLESSTQGRVVRKETSPDGYAKFAVRTLFKIKSHTGLSAPEMKM